MNANDAWDSVITYLKSNPGDFKTVPRINRSPLWFHAMIEGQRILVDNARQNEPSSRIAVPRSIRFNDFELVHSYYKRWESGEVGIRDEVRRQSRNTAYIFALIKYFNVG